MSLIATGYLSLGTNLGDRLANLKAGIEGLKAAEVDVLRCSSVYETEPIGPITDQNDFYNACIEISSALPPADLLERCKQTELQVGRERDGVRYGPRVLDIDILLLDGDRFESERLSVPHPEIASRRFVLQPLAELDPTIAIPNVGTVAQALAGLGEDQGVHRVAEPLVDDRSEPAGME